jgi:hypothetical protein
MGAFSLHPHNNKKNPKEREKFMETNREEITFLPGCQHINPKNWALRFASSDPLIRLGYGSCRKMSSSTTSTTQSSAQKTAGSKKSKNKPWLSTRTIFAFTALCAFFWLIFPAEIFAVSVDKFGGKEIFTVGTDLHSLMFNLLLPAICTLGAGWRIIQSYRAGNPEAMFMYALVVVVSWMLPMFIKGVYGEAMVLP